MTNSIYNVKYDFQVHSQWGFYDQNSREVVYIKRWQNLMRKEFKKLWAEEISPNIYDVDPFFWDNIFERKSTEATIFEKALKDVSHPSVAATTTRFILYWAKRGEQIKSDVHRLWGNNLNESQLQSAYLGWYTQQNIMSHGLNNGTIPNDDLVFRPSELNQRSQKDTAVMQNIRLNMMAISSMLKWMGSNEGQSFIEGCERNLSIKASGDKLIRSPHLSRQSPVQQYLAARPR